MSVIEVYILWTLFTYLHHPSGAGTDKGELEEKVKVISGRICTPGFRRLELDISWPILS